ncbi:MAG: M23 family metallopeptidase [Verrucomicrobiota bacterium]
MSEVEVATEEKSATGTSDQAHQNPSLSEPSERVIPAEPAGSVPLADAFDFPVGGPNGEGYYVSRGFIPDVHPGEDWNGNQGGNTDLGDPVKSIANGHVVYADDAKKGWGNVVIVRHAYLSKEDGLKEIDSLYGLLDQIHVEPGDVVKRGQQIGTIGRGPKNMYSAHLYFEIRKNTNILMDRPSYPKDSTHYFLPRHFIGAHRD